MIDQSRQYYFRLNLFHRILHGVLMTSFLGLAATGMPLRFNQAAWAIGFADAIGGFGAILFFHKTFAVLLPRPSRVCLSPGLCQGRDRGLLGADLDGAAA
jgi:hypothetical protein